MPITYIIDHTIKCCAVSSDDLTAVVQSEGDAAKYLIVSSINILVCGIN